MPEKFQYDVFLSHNAKDKAVVCPLSEQLRTERISVWTYKWILKPDDIIPKNKEGKKCPNATSASPHFIDINWVRTWFASPLSRSKTSS